MSVAILKAAPELVSAPKGKGKVWVWALSRTVSGKTDRSIVKNVGEARKGLAEQIYALLKLGLEVKASFTDQTGGGDTGHYQVDKDGSARLVSLTEVAAKNTSIGPRCHNLPIPEATRQERRRAVARPKTPGKPAVSARPATAAVKPRPTVKPKPAPTGSKPKPTPSAVVPAPVKKPTTRPPAPAAKVPTPAPKRPTTQPKVAAKRKLSPGLIAFQAFVAEQQAQGKTYGQAQALWAKKKNGGKTPAPKPSPSQGKKTTPASRPTSGVAVPPRHPTPAPIRFPTPAPVRQQTPAPNRPVSRPLPPPDNGDEYAFPVFNVPTPQPPRHTSIPGTMPLPPRPPTRPPSGASIMAPSGHRTVPPIPAPAPAGAPDLSALQALLANTMAGVTLR